MRTNILTARVAAAKIGNPITLERLIERNNVIKQKFVMASKTDKLAAECDKYVVVDNFTGACKKLAEENFIFNKNRIAASKQLQAVKQKFVVTNKLTDACQKLADGYDINSESYAANADRIWESETITRITTTMKNGKKRSKIQEINGFLASEKYKTTSELANINAENYACNKLSAAEIKCQKKIFAHNPKSKNVKESIKAANSATDKIPMVIRSRNNPTAAMDTPTLELKNKRMLIGLAERYSNIIHVSSETESNTMVKTLRLKNKLRTQCYKMDKKRIINNCIQLSDEYKNEIAKTLAPNPAISGMLSTIPLWEADIQKISQKALIKQLKKSTSEMHDGEFVAKALRIAEIEQNKTSVFDRIWNKIFA